MGVKIEVAVVLSSHEKAVEVFDCLPWTSCDDLKLEQIHAINDLYGVSKLNVNRINQYLLLHQANLRLPVVEIHCTSD